ncbi:MAG: hypothetical protein LBL62_06695 [Planctomycetaceae bacterium]|nr:hypothetical protein [Planctomycetaceae bacterium]
MTPTRKATPFAVVTSDSLSAKVVGDSFAICQKGRAGCSVLIPKRKATQFAIVNRVHCRRVRRRDLLAKGRPPTKGYPPDDCLPLTKIPLGDT